MRMARRPQENFLGCHLDNAAAMHDRETMNHMSDAGNPADFVPLRRRLLQRQDRGQFFASLERPRWKGRKHFFFEKKKQKTFVPWCVDFQNTSLKK